MAGSKDDSRSSIAKSTPEHAETLPVPKTPQERQIALKAALEIDPGVTRFSWRAFQVLLAHFWYLATHQVCLLPDVSRHLGGMLLFR
jgi:hypothetical protein